MMNRKTVAFLLSITIALAACGGPSGPSPKAGSISGFPAALPGFQPRQTYPTAMNVVWDVTISILHSNGIAISSSSRENKQISTDYVGDGSRTSIGFAVSEGQQIRHKYNIFFEPRGASQTYVSIVPVIEAATVTAVINNVNSVGFHDVSGLNPQIVQQVRDWLYERIESSLPRA